MREIKFRVFRPSTNQMQMVTQIMWGDLVNHGAISHISSTQSDLDPNKVVLMQFTGLKDKNGKEIYEGDKVRATYDQYSFNCSIEYSEDVCGYILKDIRNRNVLSLTIGEYELEVIGNIHEPVPQLTKS